MTKFTAKVSEYLRPEEVNAIINAIPKLRDQLFVRVMWETGARVSEVSYLIRHNIIERDNCLVLDNLKQNKRKVTAEEKAQGIRPQDKPKLPPDLKRVYLSNDSTLVMDVLDYCEETGVHPDGYVFISRLGKPLGRTYIWRLLSDPEKGIAAKLDIRRIKVDPTTGRKKNKPAWSHLLRHGRGQYLLQQTGRLDVVGRHLGHATIQSTEIYAGLTDSDQKELVQKTET